MSRLRFGSSALVCLAIFAMVFSAACASTQSHAVSPMHGSLGSEVVRSYAAYVHASYGETLKGAEALKDAVDAFIKAPSAEGLEAAKARWVSARVPYGKTEVFRFYEGPIDAPARGESPEGPEGRLNAWPMNEAYLDSVKGKPDAGILHDPQVPITLAAMLERNTTNDEAEVTLGWHALEFMLWGQDHADEGPGARPWSDFAGDASVAVRRRAYLGLLAEILVQDLRGLVSAWHPSGDTYGARFAKLPGDEALTHIMSAMATLSGFELASERIAVALDSRSQEDEHSCFSDTTHQDIQANAWGIREVYLGGTSAGHTGVHALALEVAPQEAKELEALIRESTALADACPVPVDQVLIAPDTDPRRAKLQSLVNVLQRQAEALKTLGTTMGLTVSIHAE